MAGYAAATYFYLIPLLVGLQIRQVTLWQFAKASLKIHESLIHNSLAVDSSSS